MVRGVGLRLRPFQRRKPQLSPEKGQEGLPTASGAMSNKEGNLPTTMTLTEEDRCSTVDADQVLVSAFKFRGTAGTGNCGGKERII